MLSVYQAHTGVMFGSTVRFFIIFFHTVQGIPCISYAIYTHLFYALRLQKEFYIPFEKKKNLPLV